MGSISVVNVWNANNGNLLQSYQDGFGMTFIEWSPTNPDQLAITNAANYEGAKIVLWDATSDSVIWELETPNYGVTYIAWNSQGNKLATVTEDANALGVVASIYDAANGSLISTIPTQMVYKGSITWSPSLYIAISDGNIIQIWHDNPVQLVTTFQTASFVNAITWQPNGTSLSYAGSDGIIQSVSVLSATLTVTPTITPTSTATAIPTSTTHG